MSVTEEDGIIHIVGQAGEILWDARYAPVYMANSYGAWDEEQVVSWYELRNSNYDADIKKGLSVYLISDISELKAPDATMRQKLGEFGHKYDTPYKGTWIGQTFIMTNPLLRGIVTAVNWLNPNGFVAPTTTAPSMKQAIESMEKAYARNNLEIPRTPQDYKFPDFKDRPA